MPLLQDYVSQFPMTPFGGAFLAGAGLCVVLGAFLPRYRMRLVGVGFALGSLAIVFFGRTLARGLYAPTGLQITALALAFAFEFAAFALVMPRVRGRGERAVVATTLAIVGLHFFIMTPAFGPLIALMATLCTANAAAFWVFARYPASAAWFVDGGLKLGLGLLMAATSPALFG